MKKINYRVKLEKDMGKKEKRCFCYKQDTGNSFRNDGVGKRIEGVIMREEVIRNSAFLLRQRGVWLKMLPKSCPSGWS